MSPSLLQFEPALWALTGPADSAHEARSVEPILMVLLDFSH